MLCAANSILPNKLILQFDKLDLVRFMKYIKLWQNNDERRSFFRFSQIIFNFTVRKMKRRKCVSIYEKNTNHYFVIQLFNFFSIIFYKSSKVGSIKE